MQKAIGYNPHTKPVKEKRSLSFDPIFNQVQKLRCCTEIAGAVYHSSINNVCGGSLAAEFSILNGGRLEVAAAPLSYVLMAAVRASLTALSIQLTIDYEYRECM